MALGERALTFELVPDWEHMPTGFSHGDVAGVATDAQDRVYVFNRSEHPVMVYDRARQKTVLYGGIAGSGDTWEWDGQQWRQIVP